MKLRCALKLALKQLQAVFFLPLHCAHSALNKNKTTRSNLSALIQAESNNRSVLTYFLTLKVMRPQLSY